MKTDFSRWKDEDESDSDTENPYNDDSLNAVSYPFYISTKKVTKNYLETFLF